MSRIDQMRSVRPSAIAGVRGANFLSWGWVKRNRKERGIDCPSCAAQDRNSSRVKYAIQTGEQRGIYCTVRCWREVMVACSLITQRPLDEDKTGWLGDRVNLPCRGHTDEQPTT